jgi:hypothetical protein
MLDQIKPDVSRKSRNYKENKEKGSHTETMLPKDELDKINKFKVFPH